jgi:hypothetical protein
MMTRRLVSRRAGHRPVRPPTWSVTNSAARKIVWKPEAMTETITGAGRCAAVTDDDLLDEPGPGGG